MTISKLAMAAKRVIDAEWLNGEAYDLSTQAAEALESRCMLQSPETAAELERLRVAYKAVSEREHELIEERDALRARVAELEQRVADAVEYGIRIPNGSVLLDGSPTDRRDQEARLDRYRDTWPEAVLVERSVFHGEWAERPDAQAPADKLTRLLAPTQALRETDGEHYAAVHHTYRVPRDLPPLDGAR
ncbi:hypothetical protein K4749_01025 [Streptomyces sp. TRM72054]|uniref:hypothetical protein n=1 Tax=Streptomyces sp. TRM72054 TaxID=2870562 RepID=UPI001C8BE163|nr:hypothetical protein [Streptomyces sp. TRM72054]MBX9392212.1 hypothetical protein [Streptomyces sp. TRM72054]